MRRQRQQVFRTDAATKLDDLELVAALLIRDITSTRAFITERGVQLLPESGRRRRVPHRRGRDLVAKALSLAWSAASGIARHASHPRLRAGLRAGFAFIVDFVIVLSAASAAAAAIAAAFALV